MKILVFFILFLITLQCVFGITTEAVFEVGNEKPKIIFVDKLLNEIQIKVEDTNGYEDIDYVKVISGGKSEYATFKSGSGIDALYVYYLISDKAKIEVSDGVNVVEFNYEIPKGMSSITGSVVLEEPKNKQVNPVTGFFKSFFKKLFSLF